MDFSQLTFLRIIGMMGGFACLLLVAYRLQAKNNDAINTLLLLPTGLILLLLTFFPTIVDIPLSFLKIEPYRGSRLIFLTIIVIVIIWFFLISLIRKNIKLGNQINDMQVSLASRTFVDSLDNDISRKTVLVVMPALNEEKNLKHVLANFPQKIDDYQIIPLVIDDGSTDDTAATAKKMGVMVAMHPMRYGGGSAVRTGYQIAGLLNVDYLVTMDADGQHDPGEIPSLVRPLIDNKADLVIGSRQLGKSEQYSTLRYNGVIILSKVISLMMGSNITDCSSGFRSFRVSKLKKLHMIATQYHTAETIIKAIKHNWRITEVAVTISRRHSGESKKGHDILYAYRFARSLLRYWWS